MANDTKRVKMSRQNRAKQFMPFAALTGHREEIEERTKKPEKRRIHSDQLKEDICWKLKEIKPGDSVKVIYYNIDRYSRAEGVAGKVKVEQGSFVVDGKEIKLEDIWEIEFDNGEFFR